MKEFKNDSSETLARFGRDKRLRTVKTVKTEYVERRPAEKRDNRETRNSRPFRESEGRDAATTYKRKSYNPNFRNEQKPVRDAEWTPRPKSSYGGKTYSSVAPRGVKPVREGIGGEHSADYKPRTSSAYGNRTATRKTDYKPARYGQQREDGNTAKPAAYGKKNYAKSPVRQAKPYPKYNPERQTGEIRLNRFIAQSGICSRREADSYITAGLVTVNGQIVTELGTKILPTDEVRFNNETVRGEQKVYLVLNKPKGYVTTLDDPHATKIVTDLVKNACTERIYPVGRLDKNSLGLLLFTNDGDLTKQLTHPSYQKKKIYQVRLDKPLTRADMQQIADGITLEDGDIFADEISYVKDDKKEIGIEIHSGRNRIVRRIFEHLGYTVQKLDRVYYAGLTKKNLKRGAWRFLTKEEVMRLKTGMYE